MRGVSDGAGRDSVPYSAVIYDAEGSRLGYVSEETARVRAQRSSSKTSCLDAGGMRGPDAGPPSGTAVVTVGVAELYGTEIRGRSLTATLGRQKGGIRR